MIPWCVACSAWETISLELCADWQGPLGLRSIAGHSVLNCAREVRAHGALGAGVRALGREVALNLPHLVIRKGQKQWLQLQPRPRLTRGLWLQASKPMGRVKSRRRLKRKEKEAKSPGQHFPGEEGARLEQDRRVPVEPSRASP